MKINSRKVAMEILDDIEKKGSFSNKILLKTFSSLDIEAIDRRFISKLVYGVIENKIYLDYIIRKFSSVRLKKINTTVLNLLRLGAYQIIFLSKTPDSAAVNESVKLTKKASYRHSGFVNGLLRNISRSYKEVKLPSKKNNLISYLSIKYSHPEWLVERWIKDFGKDFVEELLISNNKIPYLSLRTNTLLIKREDLITKLQSIGIECEKSVIVEEGVIITKTNDMPIETIDLFINGFFTIQDESSMILSRIVNPSEGDKILDLCSAPGGKTTHIASLMNNTGEIIACDISDKKLEYVKENLTRLKIKNTKLIINDATNLNGDFINKFDKVIVDVPCSGFGIIRRKPDIKYNKSVEDIIMLNKIQYEILKNAAEYVKTNGILIYSTCTIDKSENSKMINKFLENYKNFEVKSLEFIEGVTINGSNELQLFPNVNNTDGFYCCKLIKI